MTTNHIKDLWSLERIGITNIYGYSTWPQCRAFSSEGLKCSILPQAIHPRPKQGPNKALANRKLQPYLVFIWGWGVYGWAGDGIGLYEVWDSALSFL